MTLKCIEKWNNLIWVENFYSHEWKAALISSNMKIVVWYNASIKSITLESSQWYYKERLYLHIQNLFLLKEQASN